MLAIILNLVERDRGIIFWYRAETHIITDMDDNVPEGQIDIDRLISERWEVLERIGEGGMSEVFKARHVLMRKIGAIKFLKGNLSHDPQAVRRFQQEALASGSLGHPNIVQVYDCGVAPQGFYLILEFLEGMSLADVLDERADYAPDGRGRLHIEEAVPIFVQICEGLAHAHHKGIVHRDMKPSNVMLTGLTAGSLSESHIKLVDFGIAKMLRAETREAKSLTKTGEVFGSPLYMSPEQCLGKDMDGRSDIYSLGCLMWEAVAGRKALMGKNPTETMMKHVQEAPDLSGLENIDYDHPEFFASIISACLAKNPDDRFQTMEELRDALLELPLSHHEPPANPQESLKLKAMIAGLAFAASFVVMTMGIAIFSQWDVRPPYQLRLQDDLDHTSGFGSKSGSESVANQNFSRVLEPTSGLLESSVRDQLSAVNFVRAMLKDGNNLLAAGKTADAYHRLDGLSEWLDSDNGKRLKDQLPYAKLDVLGGIAAAICATKGDRDIELDQIDGRLANAIYKARKLECDGDKARSVVDAYAARARVQLAKDSKKACADTIVTMLAFEGEHQDSLDAVRRAIWANLAASLYASSATSAQDMRLLDESRHLYAQTISSLASLSESKTKTPITASDPGAVLRQSMLAHYGLGQVQYILGELSNNNEKTEHYKAAFDEVQTAIGMAKQARLSEAAISGMHAQAFLAVKKYDTFKAVLYRLNNHV
jgi:serine/threonine protein kinase